MTGVWYHLRYHSSSSFLYEMISDIINLWIHRWQECETKCPQYDKQGSIYCTIGMGVSPVQITKHAFIWNLAPFNIMWWDMHYDIIQSSVYDIRSRDVVALRSGWSSFDRQFEIWILSPRRRGRFAAQRSVRLARVVPAQAGGSGRPIRLGDSESEQLPQLKVCAGCVRMLDTKVMGLCLTAPGAGLWPSGPRPNNKRGSPCPNLSQSGQRHNNMSLGLQVSHWHDPWSRP